jgi:hypothetical protein
MIQDDVVVVDRGFRDSVNIMEGLGLEVAMPPFLEGRRQFSTTETNQSRCITKVRWIVEAVNGQMKQFKFLSNTIQNSSLPHLEAYISIVCSIINRYRLPMVTSNVQNEKIGQQMLLLKEKKNKFEQVMKFI